MPSPRRLLLFALPVLAACGPSPAPDAAAPASPPAPPAEPAPAADAVQEVKASMDRFLAARSFHAVMRMEGARPLASEMDYVAPDRYRITLPVGTQTVIGDVLHMQVDGRQTQVPLPAETLAPWRDPLKLRQAHRSLSAERLGPDTVEGRPAIRYHVRHREPQPVEFDYWVGGDGRPLQLRHAGADKDGRAYTVWQTYSRYDDPSIAIDLPR